MENKKGCIYILTNPSFPKFVKIGYADDVYQRLNQLNRSECIPYAFRLYAYYEVASRLTDIRLHNMIDKLNPNLRAIEDFNGKKRVREFYAMDAEEAYSILETIAELNGMQENLHLVEPTMAEVDAEEEAAEITGIKINRHHFKDCFFTSSLTGKTYKGTTSNTGVLSIIDINTKQEVPNNSNPSKKSIIGQAIVDLGGTTDSNESLYQRYRKLTRLLSGVDNTKIINETINQGLKFEKNISINDIRAKIVRVPNEIVKIIGDNNEVLVKLGNLDEKTYKYNSNGRFISGVSKFLKLYGFLNENGEFISKKVTWILDGDKIKVVVNNE